MARLDSEDVSLRCLRRPGVLLWEVRGTGLISAMCQGEMVGLSRNLRGGAIPEFETEVEVVAHFAPGLGRLGVVACPSP